MNKLKVFGAAWCGGCTTLKTSLANANVEYEQFDADNDEHQEEFLKYGVRGLPTAVFVNDKDEVVRVIVGLQPISEYQKWIK